MKIGIITGSGFYDFPALETASIKKISTKFGEVELQTSKRNGHDLFFMTRHGAGHRRLPNAINYRANILALKECGVDLIVATSVMGIIDNKLPLAQLMLFNDLFFLDNRLPGGETCTLYEMDNDPNRGHYLFDRPLSFKGLDCARSAAEKTGIPYTDNLIHGHSGGPRFNSKAEIAFLKNAGSQTVSQTVGPEIVLAGESEIGFILLGFGVDYANGVKENPTPVEVLNANLEKSKGIFASMILSIVDEIDEGMTFFDNGFVYRFE